MCSIISITVVLQFVNKFVVDILQNVLYNEVEQRNQANKKQRKQTLNYLCKYCVYYQGECKWLMQWNWAGEQAWTEKR